MKFTRILSVSLISACVLGAYAQKEEGCTCKPAPAFSGTANDGKTYSLKQLAKTGPAIFVFLKNGCPANPSGIADMNRLHAQLGSKVPMYGVIQGSVADAKATAKQFKATFPIISDPKTVFAKGLAVEKSMSLAILCKDGDVPMTTMGYSQKILADVLAELPHHGGPKLKVDLSKYPKTTKFGCSF